MELSRVPQKKNTGAKTIILIIVILVAIGGGIAYRVATKPGAPPPPEPTLTPAFSPEPTPTDQAAATENPFQPSVIKKIAGKVTAVNVGENFLKLSVSQPKRMEFKVLLTRETVVKPVAIPNRFIDPAKKGSLAEIRVGDSAEILTVEAITENPPQTVTATLIQALRL